MVREIVIVKRSRHFMVTRKLNFLLKSFFHGILFFHLFSTDLHIDKTKSSTFTKKKCYSNYIDGCCGHVMCGRSTVLLLCCCCCCSDNQTIALTHFVEYAIKMQLWLGVISANFLMRFFSYTCSSPRVWNIIFDSINQIVCVVSLIVPKQMMLTLKTNIA